LTDPDGLPGDLFGYINAGIGDLNADEIPDILVGAYGADTVVDSAAGKVIVFSGADFSILRTLYDPAGSTGYEFGRGLVVLSDVSGDGVDDILIGSPGDLSTRGSVSLFSGATGGLIDKMTDPQGEAADRFGYHVTALGDLDLDGIDDMLVGAHGDDTGLGHNTGSASILSGATHELIYKLVDSEGVPGDLFGFSGVGVDDYTGDGIPDVLIGAYRDDNAKGDAAGKVILFSGSTVNDNDGDGTGDACDGDMDGDGLDNEADCAPLDGNVTDSPGAVGATLEWSHDRDWLWWQPVAQATEYHVYYGWMVTPEDSPGLPQCWRSTPTPTTGAPNPDAYFYYWLVSAVNECGESSLGTTSEDIERPNNHPCP
jgi:hypothetical protein